LTEILTLGKARQMTYEESGEVVGFAAEVDPDSWLWLPGVDYVTGWQTAQAAVETLRAALASVGLGRDQFTATAGTLSDGRGIVRLKGSLDGVQRLIELLDQLADSRPTDVT
jgi:hypothetical protein